MSKESWVFLQIVDLSTRLDEVRAWMDAHGLADHALLDGVPTYEVIASGERTAIVQMQQVQVISVAIDRETQAPTSCRIMQALAGGAGFMGDAMIMMDERAPGVPLLDKVLEPIIGYRFYDMPQFNEGQDHG